MSKVALVGGSFMNVGKIVCNIYFCYLFSPHGYHGTQILVYIKLTVYKRGWFLIQRIPNLILCDNHLVASRLCMEKAHLKIRYQKRGLCLEKDCVTNMRDLRHEYGAPSCVMNMKGVAF